MSKHFGKLLAGMGLGVGLGLLFAPEKGEKTRKKLMAKLNEMYENAKNVDVDDVKDSIENQILEIKEELSDLDKEKALKIAKEKGKKIVKKSEELYKLAVEKGTPVLESAADEIRKTSIEVLNTITNKLEKKSTKK